MLAALPLGSGRAIADPFEPTAEVVALLELRREQMESADGETGQRARGLRAPAPRPPLPRRLEPPKTPEGLQPDPLLRTAPAHSLRPAPFRFLDAHALEVGPGDRARVAQEDPLRLRAVEARVADHHLQAEAVLHGHETARQRVRRRRELEGALRGARVSSTCW